MQYQKILQVPKTSFAAKYAQVLLGRLSPDLQELVLLLCSTCLNYLEGTA